MPNIQPHEPGPRSDRLSIRLEPDIKQRIEAAAALDHRSVTSFIIASAIESADRILKRDDTMQLSERDWETLMDAIEDPPKPNVTLKRAFANYKKAKIRSDV